MAVVLFFYFRFVFSETSPRGDVWKFIYGDVGRPMAQNGGNESFCVESNF